MSIQLLVISLTLVAVAIALIKLVVLFAGVLVLSLARKAAMLTSLAVETFPWLWYVTQAPNASSLT